MNHDPSRKILSKVFGVIVEMVQQLHRSRKLVKDAFKSAKAIADKEVAGRV